MKIRIQGNSIRLRLSQSEVKTFHETGAVQDQISFGVAPDDVLTYALKRIDIPDISAFFAQNQITVQVPPEKAIAWATSEKQIGMEHLMRHSSGENGALRILIEKDFKCLADRPEEDESDNFPNPNLSC